MTKGDRLDSEFPLVHAVGRAASRHHAPRMIELVWGNEKAPKLTLIGKGVSFDTGGLDLKPARAMALMKKDMGGAAHALALAGLIMGAGLSVRLQLLIPAVENAVAGNAFRPGDVLKSRLGLTVEIGNTDAEGRLILADALALASEGTPELIIDFATLTGAARVALGPDLPALMARRDDTARALMEAGHRSGRRSLAAAASRRPMPTTSNPTSPTSTTPTTTALPGRSSPACSSRSSSVRASTGRISTPSLGAPRASRGGPRAAIALGLRAAWGYAGRRGFFG